jgi:Na+-driven multidrug efflux pump
MYFGAEWMIGIFTNEPEVLAQGARCLRIVAWVEAPFGVALVVSAALRAAGDALVPLWAGISTMWAVRQTAARLFVLKMGLGLAGAWYAMDLDCGLRWLFLWLYFRSGRWKRVSRRLAEKTRQSVIQ